MIKKLSLIICVLLSCGSINAQVTNRAIQFESTGTVDCGQVPGLDGLTSFTVQFWINPTQWTEGATIMSRGDKFSAKLGSQGNIVFTVGDKSVTASSADLKAGEWNGVMLNCANNVATTYINNVKSATATLDAVPQTDAALTLGGGYVGKLDEVRVWNDELSDDFDYFTNNTLNKWAPQWDNLLVYYKMDQKDAVDVLINYRDIFGSEQVWNNHGVMSDGVTRVSADNDKMPYLWNAAYTENARFFDRIIPQDQYLLSNAVIILGSDADATDGSIKVRTPNYHALEVGATYMPEFEGRNGVVSFDGTAASKITSPHNALEMPSAAKNYTFETWLYLDEWTPGAYLARCETDDQKNGIAVYLGPDDQKRIFVRINGEYFASKANLIKTGEWTHFAVQTGTGSSVSQTFSFYVNGTRSTTEALASSGSKDVIATGNDDCLAYFGEGLKGKMDEIAYINTAVNSVASHMNGLPFPSLTGNQDVNMMNASKIAYLFDDPDWVGFSSYSQDSWLKIMQKAYEGYDGARFYFSVRGATGGDWPNITTNDAKRKKFAADLAELSKLYDGVELDLEWVYDANGWKNYSLLSDAILAALPEGKEFRISTHNVTYAYPKDKINDADGFTFQQYGPDKVHFQYSHFVNMCKNFVNYGYPKDLIVTSYSTTTSKGSGGADIQGVRLNFFSDGYVPSEDDVESKVKNGQTFYFMGPLQVYNRAKYTREQRFQGIFYWDMGNDYWLGTAANPEMPEYNSAKYCSYAINSNVDPIMTGAEAVHYRPDGDYPDGVTDVIIEKGEAVKVFPSPATDNATITLANSEAVDEINVFSMGGAAVLSQKDSNTINVSGLLPGLYLINVKGLSGNTYKTKFTVR